MRRTMPMVLPELKLAARNLARHRVRTLISLSAIVFGVAALLIAGGFIEWIFWAMRDATINTGLGHIHISRPGFRSAGLANPSAYVLPENAPALDIARHGPGAVAVDERLMVNGLASSGDITVAFTGEAVDPVANATISRILPVAGRNLDRGDAAGVLLGRGLAQHLGIGVGDTVTFLVSLPGGGINAVDAHVRGMFATQVRSYDDSAVRMPLALGRQLLRARGAHEWVIGLASTDDTDAFVAFLNRSLPAGQFEIASWFQLSDFYRKSVVLLSRQVDIVTLLIGMIIVLGISNALTMNVLERTQEIGTLMALGTSRSGILRQFVLEGMLLGFVGGALGVVIGYLLAAGLSYIGIPMPPPPGRDTGYSARIILTTGVIASGFLVAFIATTLASVYPSWRASRLTIVDALRHDH